MERLKEILVEEQERYVNDGEALMLKDGEFDAVLELLERTTGERLEFIGAEPREGKVRLKAPMPSLNKIKGKDALKKLKRFVKENPPPYLISNKEDGTGLQLEYENGELRILTGGNGEEGVDVSYIKDFIEIPILEEGLIRGELTISKKRFKELAPLLKKRGKKATNSRAAVNGTVGTNDPDGEVLQECTFVSFGILSEDMDALQQFQALEEAGFTVPPYTVIDDNFVGREEEFLNFLLKDLDERNRTSEFQIDGSVVTSIPNSHRVTENRNPTFAFAFKKDTHVAAVVSGMEYNMTSRYGYLTPIVLFEPFDILGVKVSRATGHNARFLIEKNVGIGSVVTATLGGNIIPKVKSSPVPGVPMEPDIPWHWDDNGVELVVDDYLSYPATHVAIMLHFIDTLKIKNCGESTIIKMYNAGITDIGKFIRVDQELLESLERMGETSARNLIDEIKKALSNCTYAMLMYATSIFGEGCGKETFESFINNFPTWEFDEITEEDIIKVDGFGPVKSKQLAEGLHLFKAWLKKHPECVPKKKKIIEAKNRDLLGQIIIMTGIHNDVIKENLISRGATVKDSWVKPATMVLAKNIHETSRTIVKGLEKGIPIVPVDAFPSFEGYL